MFGFLFNAPAWQLIAQSDIMTKLVLLGLLVLSVCCVWIFLSKYLLQRQYKIGMQQLLLQITRVHDFDELIALSKHDQDSPGGRFLRRVIVDLKEFLQKKEPLSPKKVEQLQMMLDQELARVLAEEEQYVPFLSATAVISPLIGLFGTVWGLIHAFLSISQSHSADIAVVAPGIAEALLTTLGGLIVAIPALAFAHYFSNEVRKLEQHLFVISDKFLSIVQQTFVSI